MKNTRMKEREHNNMNSGREREYKHEHGQKSDVFCPDDDKVVFIPAEHIRAFESIYGKMEQVRSELRKVAEKLELETLKIPGSY